MPYMLHTFGPDHMTDKACAVYGDMPGIFNHLQLTAFSITPLARGRGMLTRFTICLRLAPSAALNERSLQVHHVTIRSCTTSWLRNCAGLQIDSAEIGSAPLIESSMLTLS